MESGLALKLLREIKDTFEGLVTVGDIVTDSDSMMRSHCRHTINNGELPDNAPELIFLADPSYRVKVVRKPIFAMVSNTKDPDKCKNIDSVRVKRYTTYYIAQNRYVDLDRLVTNLNDNASINHFFNNHI